MKTMGDGSRMNLVKQLGMIWIFVDSQSIDSHIILASTAGSRIYDWICVGESEHTRLGLKGDDESRRGVRALSLR